MRPAFRYLVLFFLFFAVTGTGAYMAVIAVTDSAEQVVLPNLMEKDLAHVLEILTRLGLNTKLMGSGYSAEVPRNHVLSQNPEPGTLIRKGRDVMIRISLGQKEITMPDITQLPWQQARLLLENSGLKIGTLSRTFCDTILKDGVIAQYPLPENILNRDSKVNILISRGPMPVALTMPDLSGIPLSKAATLLASLQLEIGQITSHYDITSDENTILFQEPPAGGPATRGQMISIVVNRKETSSQTPPHGLNGVTWVAYRLDPGFLKKHVRIEAALYGTLLDLYDSYLSPGEEASVFIPQGIPAQVTVFVDDQPVRTEFLTPWNN